MRLIDADERKQQIESPYTEYPIMIQIRKALKDFIDDAPTIDTVKHARWISNTGGFSCSNCKYQTDDDEIGNWDITFGKWVYCPHCGAKMDL